MDWEKSNGQFSYQENLIKDNEYMAYCEVKADAFITCSKDNIATTKQRTKK